MILAGAARPRRLAAYFFYDESGVVDDYVPYMLEALRPHVDATLVVCNGLLTAEGRRKLEAVQGVEVMVRENEGFDVWAYKAAIDAVGWDELATYDELIMLNFTVMGPVGTLDDMFAEMDSRDLDFWGITVHNGAPFDPWGLMPNNFVPVHLQSHFIAVRRSMLRSTEFRRYWDELGPIRSYLDAVGKHEALFTQRFADVGFAWAAYVDTTDMLGRLFYPLFNEPVELVARRGCPIFKRKLFFAGPGAFLDENSKRPARELLDYLRGTGQYPDQLLMPHLLRSCHQFDLTTSLNLVAVLDPDVAPDPAPQTSVAAIVAAPTFAEVREFLDVLRHVPARRVVLVLPDDEGLRASATTLAQARRIPVEVTTGTSWFDGAALVDDAEILCVLEASGETSAFPHSNGDAFARDTQAAIAPSRAYVDQVLRAFADDPYLGLAVPPPPIHSRYFGAIGDAWAGTFEIVDRWADELGLTVPRNVSKPPSAPVGGSFWCRRAAVAPAVAGRAVLGHAPLSDHAWRTATRQLVALTAQAAGYLPTYVMPDFLAENYVTSLVHYMREISTRLGSRSGETFSGMVHRMHLTERLTAALPGNAHTTFTVYPSAGRGFVEETALRVPYPTPALGGRDLRATFDVPAGTEALRFDPLEGLACVCKDVRVEADVRLEIRPLNGVRLGNIDVFATADPQYEIFGEVSRAQRVDVVIGELHALGTEPHVLDELITAARVPGRASRLRRLVRR
jgi:lipopolysaccharide biosynthesis protein